MDSNDVGSDVFAASRRRFGQLVGFLGGGGAAGLPHAQLEELLATEGRQLLRQLFQDHLDLRALREVRRGDVIDAAGVPHGAVQAGHRRGLATVSGEVDVTRLAYRRRGHGNLHPADAVLNLPAEKHSHGLRRLAAVEAPADPTTTPPTRSPGPRAPRWANARPNSSPSAQRPTSRRSTPPDGPPQPTPTTCW